MPQQFDYSGIGRAGGVGTAGTDEQRKRQRPPSNEAVTLSQLIQGGGFDYEGISPAKDERSLFARAVDTVFSPIPAIQSRIESVARWMDSPGQGAGGREPEGDQAGIVSDDPGSPYGAAHRGFIGGALEGIGRLLTPGDAILTAAGLRGVREARNIRPIADAVTKAGAVALAGRGAERVADADSGGERAAGAAQALLGLAGLAGMRSPQPAPPRPPQVRARLRAAPMSVTPEGVAVPPGVDIPMQQTAPGAFAPVADPAARPAARVGRSASGDVVYSSDPNAVDLPIGPRALLPERSSALGFVTDESGVAQDAINALTAPRQLPELPPAVPRRPSASREANAGQLVPAAVAGRRTPDGEIVYSSDPTAADVAVEPRGLLPSRTGARFRVDDAGQASEGPFDYAGIGEASELPKLGPARPGPLPGVGKAANAGEILPAAVSERKFSGEPVFSGEIEAARIAQQPRMEQVFFELRRAAHARGYRGSDEALRQEFDRKLQQARSFHSEQTTELEAGGPHAILQAIADNGGIGRDPIFQGEIDTVFWEASRGNILGEYGKRGRLTKNRKMARAELGGVRDVLRNDGSGLSLDGMAEALRQDPRFANITGPREVINAVEDALTQIRNGTVRGTTVEGALDAVGVRPDRAWWKDPDSAARQNPDGADFDDFARNVDELSAGGSTSGEREPGEEGRAAIGALMHLGGAAAGAAAGGAVGDTPQERVKNALILAALAGMAPGAVGRPGGQLVGSGSTTARLVAAAPHLDPRVSGVAPVSGPRQTPALDDAGRFVAESGAANPMLLARMGGGAVGAAAGAATGDTPGERARNAMIGGALGAAAPSLVRQGVTTMARFRAPGATLAAPGTATVTAQTFPTTGRPAPQPTHTMRDPMRGVDVFLEKFAPEFRSGIREVIERNGGFEAQRRGRMPQEDVERLAQTVTVDLQRRLKPGTALNTEAVRAHVDAWAGAQAKINEMSARIRNGQNSDTDILGLETARAELNTIAASVMGARSEAGRALAQWRMLARVVATGDRQLIGETAAGLRGAAAEFAQEFGQLPNDPIARFRWLQQREHMTWREAGRQFWIGNVLSGLLTHLRNTLGNSANLISNLTVQPVAVGVDAARARITGAPRTMYLSEIPSQVAGAFYGVERGLSEAMFSLRHGVNRSALTQALSAAEAGKLDVPRIEFAGGGANPFNYSGRAMDAEDQFFRAIARNMEAAGLAHTQAKREGLTGEAFHNRMAQLLSGVGDEGERIAAAADDFARRAVFQEKGGPIVAHIQALAKRYPELSYVVPFVKTPSNILRQGFEHSPVGFGMKAARSGGREGAQAIARASLGTMAAGGLAYLAATGRLTGSGPSDPVERAQLMESGWRPNSVKIGDQYVEYALFQPIAVPAMVIANAFEQWRAAGKDEGTASKFAATAMGSIRSMLNYSFFSGVSDLFEAINERSLERAGEYFGKVASGFVPFSGALGTVARGVDSTVRDPGGFTEQVASRIPGLSDNLLPRLDRFGHDVQRPGGALKRMADPFNVSPISADPVVTEIGRLGLRVGMPSGQLSPLTRDETSTLQGALARRLEGTPEHDAIKAVLDGAELTREQKHALVKFKGSSGYELATRVLQAPGYARLSDEDKARVLAAAIARGRGVAHDAQRKVLRGRLVAPAGMR